MTTPTPAHTAHLTRWPILRTLALLALATTLFNACRSAPGDLSPPKVPRGWSEHGIASWYGPGFHGNRTANGERFDTHELTAAHKKLPFNTLVEVVNLDNGKRVRVRINDRGPFIRGRIIDLSHAAAKEIGLVRSGIAKVQIRVIGTRRPALPQTGPWTVQIAAFRDPARARRLADRLLPTFPEIQVRSDPVWHRVQLGTFQDPNQAQEAAHLLEEAGQRALVVQSNPQS